MSNCVICSAELKRWWNRRDQDAKPVTGVRADFCLWCRCLGLVPKEPG